MTKELERRGTTTAVELRAASGGSRVIGGYAAKFNKMSQDLGGFIEQIDPRFFNKSAGDGWPGVMARYNHADLLGTTAAESLRLSIDGVGLTYEVDMLADPVSERVLQLVARGDVSQSSFAFYTYEDDWENRDGTLIRTLYSGKLVDVAPVDQPAYLDTSTALRSLAETKDADVAEVKAAAAAGELDKFLARDKATTTVDLGAQTTRDGQGNHPSGRLDALRRAHEFKNPSRA